MYLIPKTIRTPTATTVPITLIIPKIWLPIFWAPAAALVLGLITRFPTCFAITGVQAVSIINTTISIGSILRELGTSYDYEIEEANRKDAIEIAKENSKKVIEAYKQLTSEEQISNLVSEITKMKNGKDNATTERANWKYLSTVNYVVVYIFLHHNVYLIP